MFKDITETIIRSACLIYNKTGFGFLESVINYFKLEKPRINEDMLLMFKFIKANSAGTIKHEIADHTGVVGLFSINRI